MRGKASTVVVASFIAWTLSLIMSWRRYVVEVSDDGVLGPHASPTVAAENIASVMRGCKVGPTGLVENVLTLKSNNPLAVEKVISADGASAIRAGEHRHI